ncbi:MAG TPA: DUF3122 domain-containing protein [Coleofasciculaceae cyanobacterium]
MLLNVFRKISELAHNAHQWWLKLRWSQLLVRCGLVLVCTLGSITFMPEPAAAILRQHQDAPGIMRYHSQQSLPDTAGKAWQVVLFKQITSGQPTRFNLRLVGFPGVAELTHPQPLELTTAGGQVLTAPDVFPHGAPAPNVGQYDFTDILNQLGTDDALAISIPLKGEKTVALNIPQTLLIEWQWLVTQIR